MRTSRAIRDRDADKLDYILQGKIRAAYAQERPAVMRAAGVRIYRMSAERMRAVAGNSQPWQKIAWGYRDMIGELRFALQYRARAISRTQWFVAQVNPDDTDDEPIPVALRNDDDAEKRARVTLPPDLCAAAESELDRLPLTEGYGFTGMWSENYDVAGECWLHGFKDPLGVEQWKIRSVLDVDIQGSDVTVKDELGQPRRVDVGTEDEPGTEEIFRLWIPHPARGHLADSALNALQDVLEDICLAGRELRAVARSRITANGVWMVPVGMSLVRNTKDDDDNPEDNDQRFMVDLQAAMLAPISNEGDPGGVVPVVLTGTREDIEVASKSHLRFEREDSPTLLAKLEASLKRMATSLDIPPEILTGMAQANHWSAWQIDAATFRHYLEPSIRLMADSLTVSYLRPALLAAGFTSEEIAKLRIWYDASRITENPNRRQDAIDARDRAAISDDAFRDALGFSDADKPTVEEQLLMIAAKVGVDPVTAAAILRAHAQQTGIGDAVPLPAAPAPPQIPSARPPQKPPAAAPDPGGTGGTGTPSTAPTGVAASITPLLVHTRDDGTTWVDASSVVRALAERTDVSVQPEYRLDTATARRIADLERALRDQLLTAIDAATNRALDRAGSRLRSKATRNPKLTAQLRDQPVTTWAAQLGREQTLALGADVRFLLNQAWSDLKELFGRRVRATAAAIADLVAGKLLGLTGKDQRATADRIVTDMGHRLEAAWTALETALTQRAERLLFGDQLDLPSDGEIPDLDVPPYLVRNALAVVGGLPETSGGIGDDGRSTTGEPLPALGTGTAVSRELKHAGVLTIGYTWVYGVTAVRNRFHPHYELDEQRFTSWLDPKLHVEPQYAWLGDYYRPGDHLGCMCDYVPGYALPAYAAQVRERLSVPSVPTREILDLAAQDDLAGRKGTTAQEIRDQYQQIQALQSRFMEGS